MSTRYNDLRASVPGTVACLSKFAQMDVQEGQLEQDFSKLAYMFVADRAAQLMRYLLGFEVVEHEPDGSRAIGIFGFKVGNDYYYIPAFFITNQVKGIDMIFSKKTNMFFPLSEGWIDNIIQRDAIELGDSASAGGIRQDFEHPDFEFIRSPNVGYSFGSKTASADYDEFADAVNGTSLFKAAWDAMCTTTVEKLRTDPEMQSALAGFAGALRGKELTKKAGAGILQQWIAERGGPASVETLFDALCTNVKFANAALTVYPDIETLHVSSFRPTAHGCQKRAEPDLRIVGTTTESTSDEDRGRWLNNGFYIEDRRDPAELSKVFEYDHEAVFGKPTQHGKFDVLMSDGTTQPCWVLQTSKACGYAKTVVVTEPFGTLKLRGVEVHEPLYVKGERKADVSGLYDSGIPLMEMEQGSTYLLLDRDGLNVIPAFHVCGTSYKPGENIKVDGSTYVHGSCEDSPSTEGSDFDIYRSSRFRDRFGHLTERGGPHECCCNNEGITLTNNTGKASKAGSRILIPSNYRAVLVNAAWDDCDRAGERQPDVNPGTLTDLRFGMKSAAFHTLEVMADGPEFYVRIDDMRPSRPMDYKLACMSLTGRIGLSVPDTERILAKAAEVHDVSTSVRLGKAAQFVGVSMPPPMPQTPGIDPYSGVPMYGPQEVEMQGSLTGAPPVPHGNPYGENLGGEGETQQMSGEPGAGPLDQQAMDLASQAAEIGQRHVFDYSAIGGLAKVYDTGALIDSYIPQFMQSIDRLGRILFLYYWKNEDFGERYGTSDTIELEDTLRSVFKQFGDLALTLRQKTIDADGAVH